MEQEACLEQLTVLSYLTSIVEIWHRNFPVF